MTSSDTQEGQEQVDTAEGQEQADTAEGVAGSDSDEGVIDPIPKKKAKRQRREPGQSLVVAQRGRGKNPTARQIHRIALSIRHSHHGLQQTALHHLRYV